MRGPQHHDLRREARRALQDRDVGSRSEPPTPFEACQEHVTASGLQLVLRERNVMRSRRVGRTTFRHLRQTFLNPGGQIGVWDDACTASHLLQSPDPHREVAMPKAPETVERRCRAKVHARRVVDAYERCQQRERVTDGDATAGCHGPSEGALQVGVHREILQEERITDVDASEALAQMDLNSAPIPPFALGQRYFSELFSSATRENIRTVPHADVLRGPIDVVWEVVAVCVDRQGALDCQGIESHNDVSAIEREACVQQLGRVELQWYLRICVCEHRGLCLWRYQQR
mmetsp:Transcript_9387/g.24593  ORF Transcript_9387/g.24593 Transcript_9387/m.24593 type:complete len:288 (+) Transcript_9387:130-993(+)